MIKTKSLFLGSAAAILAVTGAQAADPPIVESFDYVRICDAYGTGYYFIPQTETCLRISGYMQWRTFYQHNIEYSRGRNQALRTNNEEFDMFGRFRIRVDAREESEWGTLRGYYEGEVTTGGALNLRHAYLQVLGFTAGHTTTPFYYGTVGPNYGTVAGDNGTTRGPMIYYSQPFGNGFSVHIGAQESDNWDTRIVGAAMGGDDGPDGVLAFNVSQSWGGLHLAGIARHVQSFQAAPIGQEDEFGWAIAGGLQINLDFLGNGGLIKGRAVYTSGASNFAADWAPEGYIDASGDIELVDTWAVLGGIEVGLTPTLSAALYGGYTTVVDVEDYVGAVVGNSETESWWNAGASLFWNPINNLDIGLDVIYNHQEDSVRTATGFDSRDSDYWQVFVGAQRSF
ncbi:MAG: porin [Pseudomonadota bacterium]